MTNGRETYQHMEMMSLLFLEELVTGSW